MLALALAATWSADALGATLTVDRPCVNSLKQYGVVGTGFIPGAVIDVKPVKSPLDAGHFTADANGGFTGIIGAPRASSFNPLKEQPYDLAASDATGAVLATSRILVAKPSLSMPRVFDLKTKVRISARGLTPGQPVYAHVRAGGRWLRTRRLGVAGGSCGTLAVRSPVFRGLRFKKTLAQVYVQVDQGATPSIIQKPAGWKRLLVRRPVGYAYYRYRAQVVADGFHDVVVPAS